MAGGTRKAVHVEEVAKIAPEKGRNASREGGKGSLEPSRPGYPSSCKPRCSLYDSNRRNSSGKEEDKAHQDTDEDAYDDEFVI